MRKILSILLLSIFIYSGIGIANASTNDENAGKTPIDFIYIHGSDQKTVEEFDIWIDRMHPNMKKNLEANEFIQQHLLQNAYIMPDKDMLYWADRTLKDKSVVEVGLTISKLVSSCFAQLTRTTLAHLLHDAIWLQKYYNMTPILNELNQKVISNSQQGEKTVLVGYSAGTFITYQYLMRKQRNFDAVDFFKKHKDSLGSTVQDAEALESVKPNTTCVDALVDSGITIPRADGEFIANPNKTELRNNFKKLNAQTELSCAPENSISGIINFGSPIVIFYSDDITSESQQQYYIAANLYRYIVENKQFVLTVNYKTDPLGVPSENITYKEMQEYDKTIQNNGGFVYDTSVNGGIMFVASHLKYWDQTNHFTKAIAKSYEEGYKKFYGIETSDK